MLGKYTAENGPTCAARHYFPINESTAKVSGELTEAILKQRSMQTVS